MKIERPFLWLINLLLTAALSFAVLVLMEQLPALGWEWYSHSVYGMPVLLCFVAGLFARSLNKLKTPLLILSCLVSAVIIYFIFPQHSAPDITYIAFTIVLGIGIFCLGLRGDEPFPPKIAVMSIILYLFICAYFHLNTGAGEKLLPVTYCALGSFLLSFYSFNASSMKSGLHNVKGGNAMAVPAGLRGRNILIVSLFLLIAVPLASIDFLQQGLGSAVGFVLGGIWKIIAALAGAGGDSVSTPTPSPTPSEEPEPSGLPVDTGGSIAGEIFVSVFLGVMLIAAIIFIAFLLIYSQKEGGPKNFGGLKRFLKNLFKSKKIVGYEDSVEHTLDLKGFLKKRQESVSRFFEKLTSKPQRFEDMPDNRMKVRFAYKSLLNSSRVNKRAIYYTPNELASQLEVPEITALSGVYNLSRYNEASEVSDEAAQTAKDAIVVLRRGKRRER